MYWTALGPVRGMGKIQRANLDGTNVEDLVTELTGPYFGLALDVAGNKMYWTNIDFSTATRNSIQRANLDGSNIEDLLTGLSVPAGLALDVAGNKMYWTDIGAGAIHRANLDGSNVEDLLTGLSVPAGLALDVAGNKMYWTDVGTDKIQRSNLDGSNVEDLVTGLEDTPDLTLDVAARKMYWTEFARHKIQRANLDGSNIEDLVTGLQRPLGIALGIRQARAMITFNPPTIADQTFVFDAPITPLLLPSATGGTPPYTYTLSPVPDGLDFDPATQLLTGTPTTTGITNAKYTATDTIGDYADLNFTILVVSVEPPIEFDPLDVNSDGRVTVIDLAVVALFYGTQVPPGMNLPADVNADGVVNILDLTAVAQGIDAAGGNMGGLSLEVVEAALVAAAEQAADLEEVAAAPMGFGNRSDVLSSGIAYLNVSHAFADAKHPAVSDMLSAFLELLTEMAAIPETTALLPNYPNPFNPETWIPYHLATDADVTLTIYDVRGSVLRMLTLEHQSAGVYESRGRAAYWDGRNRHGEPVASGLYFYTLTAGDFTATRKLLIAK